MSAPPRNAPLVEAAVALYRAGTRIDGTWVTGDPPVANQSSAVMAPTDVVDRFAVTAQNLIDSVTGGEE